MNSQSLNIYEKALRYQFIEIMIMPQFVRTLSEGTTRLDVIQARFTLWNQVLYRCIQESNKIIEDWKRIATLVNYYEPCPICGQIISIDDACIAYKNGRELLTHHYCRKSILA